MRWWLFLVLYVSIMLFMGTVPAHAYELAGVQQYQYNASTVKAFCDDHHTELGVLDSGMSRYCQQRERKGFDKWQFLVKKYKDFEWLSESFKMIWDKWTERGRTQHSMVAYNVDHEINDYLTYLYELEQPDVNKETLRRCCKHWAKDDARWSMTIYCYKHGGSIYP